MPNASLAFANPPQDHSLNGAVVQVEFSRDDDFARSLRGTVRASALQRAKDFSASVGDGRIGSATVSAVPLHAVIVTKKHASSCGWRKNAVAPNVELIACAPASRRPT